MIKGYTGKFLSFDDPEFIKMKALRYEYLMKPIGWSKESGIEHRAEDSLNSFHYAIYSDKTSEIVGGASLILFPSNHPHSTHDNPTNLKTGQIYQMFTITSERGQGLGRSIVDAQLAKAKSKGVERVILFSRDYALPFYLKAGFTSAEPSMRVGLPHHRMWKLIK